MTAQVLFSFCGLWAFCFGFCLYRRTSILGETGEEPQPPGAAGGANKPLKRQDLLSEVLPTVDTRYPWESRRGALVRGAMMDGMSGACCVVIVAIALLCSSNKRWR